VGSLGRRGEGRREGPGGEGKRERGLGMGRGEMTKRG